MPDREQLEFGCNKAIPSTVTAAWGARAIVTADGLVDIPRDRSSTFGPGPTPSEEATTTASTWPASSPRSYVAPPTTTSWPTS